MSVAKSAGSSQAPLALVPPAPYPDLIPQIIRHASFNVMAGASGVGTTCLMSWILTRIRDGLPLFGHPTTTPAKIGYLCADRGWATAKYWLDKANYSDLAHYSLADDPQFKTLRLRNKLHLVPVLGECIDRLELPPGSLVVVDPIHLFMGNLNDYAGIAVSCLDIRRLCTSKQITIWGLGHASKQKADKKDRYARLEDRINGSGAQLGYGDTQMYLASPEETGNKFYTFSWRSHTAAAEEFKLGRSKEGMFVPWEASQEAEQENQVFQSLPEDGSGVALAIIIGLCSDLSRATVFRRLQELITDGLIERESEGVYRRAKVN